MREMPNKRRKRKRPNIKSTRKKKISSGAGVVRHSLAIYSGQIALGFVEQRGDAFAKVANGKKLGTFDSLKLAADAISATAEVA